MEKTIVINHLGPFLLTNLLLPDLQKSASVSKIALTSGERAEKARASRIINVASRLEKYGKIPAMEAELPLGSDWFQLLPGKYNPIQHYGRSKLCNLLFTYELDRRLSVASGNTNERVTVNAVTPGVVNTDLSRDVVGSWMLWAFKPLLGLVMRNVDKGAETVTWAAVSEEVENSGGKYFAAMKEIPSSESSKDEELARNVWEASELVCG